MSRVREQKIKKLKKAHIWPAIVFVVMSTVLMLLFGTISVCLILSYFATDRMQGSYENTKVIGDMLSESIDNGTEQDMLKFLENSTDYSDAIYILDKNNKVEAGFGGDTFNLDRKYNFYFFNDFSADLYFDKHDAGSIFNEEGDIDALKIVGKIMDANKSDAKETDSGIYKAMTNSWKEKKVVLTDCYWLAMPVSGGKTLLVKCTILFYSVDIGLVIIIGLASVIMMMLPLIFLLVNVLIGVSNQKRMTKLLYTDPVTYGNNWMYFEENADKVLCSKKNAGKMFAMVDFVIMKYRNYCTYHGVDEGERLLEDIDKFLSSQIDNKELCGHNGRASFALLLNCADKDACKNRVNNMLKNLTNAHGHIGNAYHAGIYFIEPEKDADGKKFVKRKNIDIDDMYNCAVTARESIPEDNPMELAVFDQKMLDAKLWEHKVQEKMQAALDNEEFIVYIQPKYNPVTEELAGAEALVRWINDEDGFVPPGKFIPIFENNGFITKLDDYMISHIAKLQADWIAKGKKVVPVSVNVSRAHFADENLAEHICGLVDEYNCPHEFLEIELTESAFFDDKAALIKTVKKLQEKGFEVSMDDFGAGYSSLNSLKDLPLDVLKLDADFFRGEDGEDRGEIVVAQAISLAKKLNMKTVAEGIEKKEHVDFLAKQNCDMIQGYYFAKPMPADEYEQRMQGQPV